MPLFCTARLTYQLPPRYTYSAQDMEGLQANVHHLLPVHSHDGHLHDPGHSLGMADTRMGVGSHYPTRPFGGMPYASPGKS